MCTTGRVMMAVPLWPVLVVLLLACAGLPCSSSPSVCPEPCTCQNAPLLNCSSSGLSSVPPYIQDSVTELDFSHNLLLSVTLHRPHRNLRNVWLGNNSITHLSLCIATNLGNQSDRDRDPSHLRPWRRRRCVSWAPTLQLLSVERNQLVELPEGLEGSLSLRILQLSFNRISALRLRDLSRLQQLKELHLQHNLITSVHPQMFENLSQLKVLDLSFNMLTSLHPLMYVSLRNIGADVRLGGNRWQCDCSMRSLRRRMAFDSSRGLQAWSMACALPSIHSGKDVLQLEEDDLNCSGTDENRPELHRDVTVHSGSEILLSCSAQDSLWWQPSGQASVREPQAGLFISDVTEKDTGLYVCISEENKVVSVFNLQISRIGHAGRTVRSLPRTIRQIIPQERSQRAAQCNLTLAVCLSVIITFLVAFIIGVLTRPCIDVLWAKVTKKKSPPATNSVSDAQQNHYENAAFNGEELNEVVTHRERRVTFSTITFREDNNEIEYEAAQAEKNTFTARHSGSENSSSEEDERGLSGVKKTRRVNKMELPNAAEKRRSSLSSDSSLSERSATEARITQRDLTPKSPPTAEDSVQQNIDYLTSRQVEAPEFSRKDRHEVPGFSHEPFTEWSPLKNDTNPTDDLWQENEEQFEFSDSGQSPSEIRGRTGDEHNSDISSSSSYVSDDEPTRYTVNSDQEGKEEEDIDIKAPTPDSSCSSDSEDEKIYHTVIPTMVNITRVPLQKSDLHGSWPALDLENIPHIKRRLDIKPLSSISDSSFSSDSKDEKIYNTVIPTEVNTTGVPLQNFQPSRQETGWPALDLQHIPHIKRRLDIKAPSSHTDSSSSSGSEDEKTYHTVIPTEVNTTRVPMQTSSTSSHDLHGSWPALDLENIPHIKRRLDIKRHLDIEAPSAEHYSSFSSDSEDEKIYNTVIPTEVNTTRVPLQNFQPSRQETGWPALDLQHIPHIKRRLDIKAPSPESESSSSGDSDDETTYHTVIPSEVNTTRVPLQKSLSSHDLYGSWPSLNLETIPHIKRRLDIKAPSPESVSSSSSDSDDETAYHTVIPSEVNTTRVPLKKSEPSSHDLHGSWPSLNLETIPHIKRRLDIKPLSPISDSSSSSKSEEEKIYNTVIPTEVNTTRVPLQNFQPSRQETGWPALDLQHIPHIKRRLDIKVPSSHTDSSSSSGSEDEKTYHTVIPTEVNTTRVPLQKSLSSHDLHGSWPSLNLENIPHIKRRLDIKRHLDIEAPSAEHYSSFSSDSEDEKIYHTVIPTEVNTTRVPLQKSEPSSHDLHGSWPSLNLENIPHIKRRLDIKPLSPISDSSSSSDSEEEKIYNTVIPTEVNTTRVPLQNFQPSRQETGWPALDLQHIPHIKRRLDIKAPSSHTDSSSSSGSEDEKTYHTVIPTEVNTTSVSLQKSEPSSHDLHGSWPSLNLENIPHIKRRLDIKRHLDIESAEHYSSFSSDSEDEKIYHTVIPSEVNTTRVPLQNFQPSTQETGWPALDLQHIPHIKRRLDIKAPSPESDSSSSSDSDDETTYHTVIPTEVNTTRVPMQTSSTSSHDLQGSWPALDLENIPHIKKRLDIKPLSPISDSSSSSKSEEEKIYNTVISTEVNTTRVPLQNFQPSRQETGWPALDLQHIPHIKRRLDIKAPSSHTDSSSSSGSEDEKTYHTVIPTEVNTTRVPLQKSLSSHDLHGSWPSLNLENIPHIKRRLDIKRHLDIEAPSAEHYSSFSSDSEDEKTYHTVIPTEVNTTRVPLQKSLSSHDLYGSWPSLNLENIPHIKRRLDIKAPSSHPDSSSSSDSEDEKTYHTVIPTEVNTTRVPLQKSLSSHDLHGSWPSLNLENIPHIKRRLDIKRHLDIEAPSAEHYSSFSSDSEDEKTYHTVIPTEVNTTRVPLQKSLSSHDLYGSWPSLNLENIPHIKRRLDIKAPSSHPDSSSSSDSEDEKTYHTVIPTDVNITRASQQKSSTSSHDLHGSWPGLNLENIPHIKRRLDIKRHLDIEAPSAEHDSSFSSDSEDEKTYHTVIPTEVNITRVPLQKSETSSHDLHGSWPGLNLENIPHIKRRLDFKSSLPHDSLSSSDSEATNHTVKGKSKNPNKITTSYSSSSSDEQEENTKDIGTSPTKVEPSPQWSELGLKRRLAIKRVSSSTDPSFSSDKSTSPTTDPFDGNNLEITNHQTGTLLLDLNKSSSPVTDLTSSPKSPVLSIFLSPKPYQGVRLEKYTTVTDDWVSKPINDDVSTAPKINPELQSRWATMNLGISRFRKRLEISSQSRVPTDLSPTSPGTPSSPNSESGTENKSSTTRLNRRAGRLQGIIPIDSSLILENKPVNVSPNLKRQDLNYSNLVEVNEDLRKDYSLPVTEDKSKPDTPLTGFTTPYISEKAPATAPLQELSDSSSSSENESVSTEYADNRWSGKSQSMNQTSLFFPHAVDDRRYESHSRTEREAVVELNSQTPGLVEESDSLRPHLSLTHIPRVKRALNIRAPSQRHDEDEDETDCSPPNFSLGVPHIRRRLDIKALAPQANHSSSASESENEATKYTVNETKYTSNMSGITDDYSHITYKRSIMKASLPLSNSLSLSGRSQTVDDAELKTQDLPESVSDRPVSFAPWRVHGVSLDEYNLYNKQIEPSRGTTDMDPPSEISWTGNSHHLSDFSTSMPSRHLDVDLPSPQEAPPALPQCSPPDSPDFSRGKSGNEIRQDSMSDVTLSHKYSYPISTRFGRLDNTASGSTSEIFKAVSENKREVKGLTALKVMSSERLQWDIKEEDFGTV